MENENVRLAATSSADPSRSENNDPTSSLLQTGFAEESLWTGMATNIRDALFPHRLPPLELTSTPVYTPDRMAGRTNPWAIGTATLLNALFIALLLLTGLHSTLNHPPLAPLGTEVRLKDFTLFTPPSALAAHGGGGGGSNSPTGPSAGHLPQLTEIPLIPPQSPVLQNPTLAIDPAISVPPQVKLPDNSLPVIGAQQTTIVKLASNGPGTHNGIGTGSNGGDGPDSGTGYGPGSDRGFGGFVYSPGIGGVTKPVVLFAPDADFSDEARRQRYQGACTITLIVDAHGDPQNPRVVQPLGMGLDEKALEAVRRYRFKPALKDGKPVASYVSVIVNFRFY